MLPDCLTPDHPPPAMRPRTWYTIRRDARMLGIPLSTLLACGTMARLHVLARQRYHALAQHSHPDHFQRRGKAVRRQSSYGHQFQAYTRAYKRLCAYPGTMSLAALQPHTEPEAVLPEAMQRPWIDLGPGYQIAWDSPWQ